MVHIVDPNERLKHVERLRSVPMGSRCAIPRYRIYRLRNGRRGFCTADHSGRYCGDWRWRVAFMNLIIAGGKSFEEAVRNGELAIKSEHLRHELWPISVLNTWRTDCCVPTNK